MLRKGAAVAFPPRLLVQAHTSPINAMSSTSDTTFSSSNFQILLDAALTKYSKRTGQTLSNHPLTAMIDRCSSPDDVLAIFEKQAEAFDEFRNGDAKLTNWLRPIVDGLYAICTNVVVGMTACNVSLVT